MIFNTTHTDREITRLIDKLVGKPYSFLDRFRVGGVGSRRMNVLELSPSLQDYQMRNEDIQFGLLELRPEGLLVLLNRQHHDFTWAIPYYKLYLYFSKNLTVHAEGHFIKFLNGYSENKEFVQRILNKIGEVNRDRVDDL